MTDRPLDAAPLLLPAAAFAAGIAGASWLAVPTPFLIGADAAFLLAGLLLATRRPGTASALVLAAMIGLGALRAAPPVLPADHIARRPPDAPLVLEARLAQEPVKWAPDRTRLLLDAEAVHAGPERLPAVGRVQITIYGLLDTPLGEGQRVLLDARLHRPIGFRNPGGFDYPAHLRREGILLVGHARADRVSALTPDAPPWRVAVKRWAVGVITARLPETSGALLAGLLLGERSALPPQSDEAFRRAGVYHILAVSGFNVALLAGAVFGGLAMGGVPRRGAAVVAAVVLIGFALVVGGQPSVVRATVMGLLLLAALLLDRESQLLNALALAVLALLLWRPGDLWEPGFQLSFAATAGIVYLAPRLAGLARHRGGGQPGCAGGGHPAHAGALQPALPHRRRRQSGGGAAGRRRHHAGHAGPAGRARHGPARRAAVPDALADPADPARARLDRGRGARCHGPSARPGRADRDRVVRRAPAPARGGRLAAEPGRRRRPPRHGGRPVRLAVAAADRDDAPRDLPRRGPGRRGADRAAGGAAPARRRRPGRGAALRRG